MSFIWFVLAIVFFILWVTKKTDSSGNGSNYGQGYWDGYRDLGAKVSSELEKETLDPEVIRAVVQTGFGNSRIPKISLEPSDLQTQSTAQAAVQPVTTDYTSPVISAEAARATDEARSLTNLNVLLFVASLLLVAAGAAFVAAAMPDSVKLIGVWLLVAAFYGAGMVLHYASNRLKPAAVAFLGTGLGLLPFAGVALNQLGGVTPEIAWCATSLIGLITYFWAAIRLQSQVVSYLTLAFVISLASSFSESVSLPIMWNFVFIIALGLSANILGVIKPNWVPRVFTEPIEQAGQWVTPLTLVASLMLTDKMSLLSYEVVFAVATLHYIVAWLQSKQLQLEVAIRILSHITLLLITWDVLDGDRAAFGVVFLLLATLQQVYSLVLFKRTNARVASEWTWIHAMQFLQFVSSMFWVQTTYDAELSTLSIILLGLSSLAATLRFRNVNAAITGLFASIVVPFMVARWVINPVLDWGIIAGWFVVAGGLVLASWSLVICRRSGAVKAFFITLFGTYALVAALLSFAVDSGWSALLFFTLATLGWVGSYVVRQAHSSIFGSVALVIGAIQLWRFLELDSTWLPLGVAWICAAIFYIGHHILNQLQDKDRAYGLLGMVWGVLAVGVLLTFFDSTLKLAAALTIVVAAATLAIEGYQRKQNHLIETAVYIASFGLQRSVSILLPELNVVFYAHWWALVVVLVAWWRHAFTTRLIVAMSFVTASTGLYALSEGGAYQLLFLVEHIVLLIAGALLSKRWAIWWGVTASSLAVLYFLKDIAFLAFGFLGLLIIGIVVWRLTKIGKN